MTAVRSGPVAVPDLTHLCRTCLERGEATLHETRLAFHKPTLTLLRIDLVVPRHSCLGARRSSETPIRSDRIDFDDLDDPEKLGRAGGTPLGVLASFEDPLRSMLLGD
jgi:hypothetical protein